MSRSFLSVTLSLILLASGMTSLSAWDNGKKTSWGIKAGLNYSGVTGLNGIQDVDLRDNTGFNVGLAFKAKLPLFFAIQPELLYFQAGTSARVSNSGLDGTLYNGNLYIPLNIQWGPDFNGFRIYAQVSPFIGFTLFNRFKWEDAAGKHIEVLSGDTNYFMGGIGAGIGFEFWRLQISAKYNWNFNKLLKDSGFLPHAFEDAKMRGLEISVGFMF